MNRHTPGSWYAVGYQVETDNDDPNVADICTCYPPNFGHSDTRSSEEILANVRLIAAAPDLLKAAKELVSWCDKNSQAGEVLFFVHNLRVAISKIEVL